jgi:hypothetical protein
MDIDRLFPVLALVLGWALNEMGASLRLRREDRRAFGPLLTDLLEMRHRLFGLDTALALLRPRLPVPPEALPLLRQLVQKLVPEAPRYRERFEDAVAQVARVNPILAFRLRGQPLALRVLSELRGIAGVDPAASLVWHRIVEPGFLDLLKANLEELILEVARAHGWWTWFRAWRRLKKPMELPRGEKERISAFVAAMKTGMPDSPNVPSPNFGKPPEPGVKPEAPCLKKEKPGRGD